MWFCFLVSETFYLELKKKHFICLLFYQALSGPMFPYFLLKKFWISKAQSKMAITKELYKT